MAVFRVERTRDYTVMSNHHLKNRLLSLKAKGLLSVMLSLPDEWDYTLRGLAAISKEGVDAIREAIRELEDAGYIVRSRGRNEKGQLSGTEYVIYEHPQQKANAPMLDFTTQEKSVVADEAKGHSAAEKPLNSNTSGSRLLRNVRQQRENTYVGKSNVGESNIGKPYVGKSNAIKY